MAVEPDVLTIEDSPRTSTTATEEPQPAGNQAEQPSEGAPDLPHADSSGDSGSRNGIVAAAESTESAGSEVAAGPAEEEEALKVAAEALPPPASDPKPAVIQPKPAAPAAAAPPTPAARPQRRAEPPPPQLPVSGPVAMPGLPDPDVAPDDDDDAFDPDSVSQDELIQATEEIPEIPGGGADVIHRGMIVSISDTAVYVDFGAKVEGVLPREDVQRGGKLVEIHPGDEIDVQLARMGAPGEYAELSYYDAEDAAAWDRAQAAHHENAVVTGRVLERVKGGLTVDVGLPAFLPGSQVDIRVGHELDSLVGEEIEVRIVKLNRKRRNIVVSRRVILEEQRAALRDETLAKLEDGAVVEGIVKNITDYGAFIDLGGIDGLLHVADISYGRVKHPSEALKVGETIQAKVIKLDPSKERVSLSLKHLKPDPWENIDSRFSVGQKTGGKVISVTDYGAFVEIEDGLEGLIHVSEIGWSRRPRHPAKIFSRDQDVEAVILKIDPGERRISLSLKRLQADPWDGIEERYQVGLVVEGAVRNLTSYGAFVELEEGVDGLIHVSDMSWDSRLRSPKEVLKKSQRVRAAVLQVDRGEKRISLGLKQLEPDAWETFCSAHLLGDIVEGAVTRQTRFGVFVELTPGVEGLCHNSEMPQNGRRKKGRPLEPGERCRFRLIKLDELGRRIALSCRGVDLDAAEDEEAPGPYVAPPPPMPITPPAEGPADDS